MIAPKNEDIVKEVMEAGKKDKQATVDSKEVYLTDYQKKLKDSWHKNHSDETEAPLIPGANNTAIWVNRKWRRSLQAQARRAKKK